MDFRSIIIPILLLTMTFLLKAFVGDRSKESAKQALCEVPVDMIVLALSFFFAFLLLRNNTHIDHFIYFILLLFGCIGAIIFSKKSVDHKDNNENKWIAYCIGNILITFIALAIVIYFVLLPIGPKLSADNELPESEKIVNVE